MTFRSVIVLAGALAFCFVSCQKESAGNPDVPSDAAFDGVWKFSSVYSQTLGDYTFQLPGDLGRTTTNTTYNSKNNSGTVTFGGGVATMSNVEYSIDTTVYVKDYDNDILTQDRDSALHQTVPVINSTTGYVLQGKDSITFTGSGLLASGDAPSPTGGHYSLSGNEMILSTSAVRDTSYTNIDGTAVQHTSVEVKFYLTK